MDYAGHSEKTGSPQWLNLYPDDFEPA
jgi:hypothetical protein